MSTVPIRAGDVVTIQATVIDTVDLGGGETNVKLDSGEHGIWIMESRLSPVVVTIEPGTDAPAATVPASQSQKANARRKTVSAKAEAPPELPPAGPETTGEQADYLPANNDAVAPDVTQSGTPEGDRE